MKLIIVESPTKARTFNRILKANNNPDYQVFATLGHIRDLPSKSISINFSNNFKPNYEVIVKKKKVVAELKRLGKKSRQVILATDPDREGESIAYHAAYFLDLIKEDWPKASLKNGKKMQRIVFHEITPKALFDALKKPESLRLNLVEAQQSRRILDRIVGYELSPLLWKKIGKNWLSAGRVQAVVLRLIVEREKEIRDFKLEPYYQLTGFFKKRIIADKTLQSAPEARETVVKAKLVSKDGQPYEEKITLNLFAGIYTYSKTNISKDSVELLKKDLIEDSYKIANLKEDVILRYPPPPYSTSLLAQDAFYRFGFSSKATMRLAQDLYERGLITYHRTDSFNLSTKFVFSAKDYIEKEYGKKYSLTKPRGYRTKSKLAQEAHEAIRPTKLDPKATERKADKKITINHRRLYSLIFNRAVATQMKEAEIKNLTISILGDKGYLFESVLQQVLFDGFLKILNPKFVASNQKLPDLLQGDKLDLADLEVQESETKSPPRYNEASLIKILEEKGIGRPSTYAPIISLIQVKNYVEKEFRYFSPTKLGEAISDYLAGSFADILNLDFTAKMEENLDNVAEDKLNFINLLEEFNNPFQDELKDKKQDKSVIDVEEEVSEKCPKCQSALVIRYSKFGKFLACSSYPKCKFTKPFLHFIKDKLCPKDGGRIVVRFSKSKRKFYGCENYPKCDYSVWKWSEIKSLKTSS